MEQRSVCGVLFDTLKFAFYFGATSSTYFIHDTLATNLVRFLWDEFTLISHKDCPKHLKQPIFDKTASDEADVTLLLVKTSNNRLKTLWLLGSYFLSKRTCFTFKAAVESHPANCNVLILKSIKALLEAVHAWCVNHPQIYKVSGFELSETLEVHVFPGVHSSFWTNFRWWFPVRCGI
jgi:hypothetical protein